MNNKSRQRELPTDPDEMFCFAVYSASHAINRAYLSHLKPLNLTYPQYITLHYLWKSDGQNVGELSKHMKMESNTMTPLLKRLEQLGHIERKRSRTDERIVQVYLTPTGKALKKEAPKITSCMIDATHLEAENLQSLVRMLGRLADNLEENRQQ